MSAEMLRQAAALMRGRAEKAYTPEGLSDYWFEDACPALAHLQKEGAHIASWHPDVAFAVADWLDGVALFLEAKEDEEYFDLDGDPITAEDTHAIGSALDVARAYLGSDQ